MEKQLTGFNRYGHMWIQFIQSLNRSHFNAKEPCVSKDISVDFGNHLNLVHWWFLLPCRHIFHLDSLTRVLTALHWETYISMFEKSGMEVYETMGTVWIEEERSYGKQDIERSNSIIRVRAYCNGASAPSTFPGQVCFPGPSMFPELRMFLGLPNYSRWVSRIPGRSWLAG